jgi:hypothetical protein
MQLKRFGSSRTSSTLGLVTISRFIGSNLASMSALAIWHQLRDVSDEKSVYRDGSRSDRSAAIGRLGHVQAYQTTNIVKPISMSP